MFKSDSRRSRRVCRFDGRLMLGALCVLAATTGGRAQGQAPAPVVPAIVLPTVTVVAEKEPAPIDRVPASVTAVTRERLEGAGLTVVSDAAWFSPNTFYSDLSARKISNARFRGIGSSPSNPGVTTFVDGVPQLNTNTANIDLLDVDQIEFVRGGASALFGRNTLGGVVNVISRAPVLTAWRGRVSVPLGTDAERGVGVSFSGPIRRDRVGGALAFSVSGRDGYSRNTVTGNLLDDRAAVSVKGQLSFASASLWSARVIVGADRSRDGDYTLGDLASLRSRPFDVARDFEGRTDRDIVSATFIAARRGGRVALTATTGVVDWRTVDETDLDYTPFPAVTRRNDEEATQVTQEVRFASAGDAPVRLGAHTTLAWHTGVFLFAQTYKQDAVNAFSPFVLSPQVPFAVANHAPQSVLDDTGVGVFGHVKATLHDRLDVSAGMRVDRESKEATLNSFFEPAIFPAARIEATRAFTSASPQVSVSFRPVAGRLIYGSLTRGFKAGGFNAASPAGNEAYGQEAAWHVEGGVKASVAGGRVAMTAAAFAIDWSEMQFNLPNVQAPGQFYIANVGGATSRGIEFDLHARVHESLRLFGALGTTRARFAERSVSSGVPVAGNRVPLTPRYTAVVGVELDRQWRAGAALTARVDVVGYGTFDYDDLNTAQQDAYALTNLRAGVRLRRLSVDAWIRNAFNTTYVPVAFPYDRGSAPSGFLGEPGKPRTFGVRIGVDF